MKSISFYSVLFYIISLTFAVSSCGGEKTTENNFVSNIQNYHKTFLANSIVFSSEKPKIYLDFSDGMSYAFKAGSPNATMIKKVASTFLTTCEWHGMGTAYPGMSIIKESSNLESLFSLILNEKSYASSSAPIDTAISRIAESNQDAIVVTDFELYTNGNITPDLPYAKDAFKKWLDNGNSISFFYSKSVFHDEKVKGNTIKDKYVFYTVFTRGRATESSIVSILQTAFDGDPSVKGAYNRYDLSSNPYSVKTEYGGTDKTGIADVQVFNQSAKMIAHDEKLGFEAIEFSQNWVTMDKFFQTSVIKNNESFLSKLFLDASNNDAFTLKKLKVVVTDVSDNFEKYSKYREAKLLESEIKLVFDPKKRDSVWSEPTQKNKKIVELYEPNSRKIIDKNKFDKVEGNEIVEIFDINSSVFEKDMAREAGKKIELKTGFNKNYSMTRIKSESKPFIIRVDYVIDQIEANRSNPKLINDLYPQIKSSIISFFDNNNKPQGIVYSYYLKFLSVN